MGDVSMVCPRPLLIDKPFLKKIFHESTNVSTGFLICVHGAGAPAGYPGYISSG